MIDVGAASDAHAIRLWIPTASTDLSHDTIGGLIQGFLFDGQVLAAERRERE